MEGGDGQPLGRLFHALGDALGHFQRGLVGKGNRGDLLRLDLAGFDQMHDLLSDHPGFAGTGAGQHQQGAVQIMDGFALAGVEPRWRESGSGGCA